MIYLDAISPLEYRYLTFPEAEELRNFFSEKAFIKYLCKAELGLVKTFSQKGFCSQDIVEEVEKSIANLKAEDVYKEEKRIHHQIKALVNCIKSNLSGKSSCWIHLGATSHDIIATAEAIRYRDATFKLMLPLLVALENKFIDFALKNKKVPQIGRTHGQHAVPITFGFAISEYVSRLGNRILQIKDCAKELRGKLAGAVGSYNALSVITEDPITFEIDYLKQFNLKPACHSTQIVEPEYFVDFFSSLISTFGVIANFVDDMRHLQRSEINEISEKIESEQVGSSTMPHKKNPITFEHVKSLWKVFMPKITTVYLDQISEHQRDLSNSASSRFQSEIFIGLYLAIRRLIRINLTIDRQYMKKNLGHNWQFTLAEPAYIILSLNGYEDAHEKVREWSRKGHNIVEKLKNELGDKFGKREQTLLSSPSNYIGKAIEKTENVCDYWTEKIKDILSTS